MTASLLVSSLSALCALGMLLYHVIFAPSRTDKKELERRLTKLELDDANHEQRLTGFSVNMEREKDRWEERCAKIEGQLSEVGQVRQDVAVIKAKMEGYGESISDMKATVNKIFDFLRVSKN